MIPSLEVFRLDETTTCTITTEEVKLNNSIQTLVIPMTEVADLRYLLSTGLDLLKRTNTTGLLQTGEVKVTVGEYISLHEGFKLDSPYVLIVALASSNIIADYR